MYYKILLAYKLVQILLQACTLCTVASSSILSTNYTDLNSLLAFKSAIEFDPKNVLAQNWTLDTDFCDWYGVSCSERGQRVTSLVLPDMGFMGTISPHVGNLSFLTVLDLNKNNFHGQVIKEIGQLNSLKELYLGNNNLTGEIPSSLSLCQKLEVILLQNNRLIGMIPANLTTLSFLKTVSVETNNLSGKIPVAIGNMSNIEMLGLAQNKFHGTILDEVALLPRLRGLTLGNNSLSGEIPPSLFNISSLVILSLESNSFSGELPKDTGLQLPNLDRLTVGGNRLTGTIPPHLYNASKLTIFAIESNNITGALPATLPLSIQILLAHGCNLGDEIPREIGNYKNLIHLGLIGNRLIGKIPPTIKGMESLQQLYLEGNELEGPLPEEICYLRNLGNLNLANNRISGSIPECIGNIHSLQQLTLAFNNISSVIPPSLWNLVNLIYLDLSSNALHGELGRNFTIIKSLELLGLSRNQLSGTIPASLGFSDRLTYLDLSRNKFWGPIPETFRNLIALVDMNISHNNLSGQIPKSLEELKYLKYLNLSYNKLSGEIPTGGPFANFMPQSFVENEKLCGVLVSRPCPTQRSKRKLFPLSYIIPIVVVVAILGASTYVFCRRSRNSSHQNPANLLEEQTSMISYHELSLATNGFCEANFLGSGGFGNVYKGILTDGTVVAVKLLNLTTHGAIKSFDSECKVLRMVRHRNLVKVINTCTNPELRALVLEYIPNGSLEKWLYSHNYYLSFLERVSIMLDVAVALDYLHCGLLEPVLHCDLKPSNILLDDDLVAHVADFGISRILPSYKTEVQTSTLGTFGYIAPEYGTEGRLSIKGDTYSYGIMLLEIFTRKKPTDEMFSQELSLRQWVSSSVSDGRVDVVIDENLLDEECQGILSISLQSNLLAILDLGLGCSKESPQDRFEMKDVVTKLNKIKLQLDVAGKMSGRKGMISNKQLWDK